MNKVAIEVDGDLFISPHANVKYVQLNPAPEALPSGFVKGATIIE